MKRPALLCILLAGFASFSFAQTETHQIVMPKRIYVGDTAELRYSFQSNVDFFPNEENVTEKPLVFGKLPFDYDNENFTLTRAEIQRSGAMYSVVLTFSPWKVGFVDFPQFDLLAAVFGTTSSVPFMIDPEPVEVISILPKGEDTALKPVAGPLLVPGTIYVVYGIILLILLMFVFVLHVVVRWQQISEKISARKILRMYAKNARIAVKRFKKLEKNSSKLNDSAFCHGLQQIFRNYLSTRFGVKFEVLSTNQIKPAFDVIYAETMGGVLQNNVFELSSIFIRADYVRFAPGNLKEKERSELLVKSRDIVKVFETGEENA